MRLRAQRGLERGQRSGAATLHGRPDARTDRRARPQGHGSTTPSRLSHDHHLYTRARSERRVCRFACALRRTTSNTALFLPGTNFSSRLRRASNAFTSSDVAARAAAARGSRYDQLRFDPDREEEHLLAVASRQTARAARSTTGSPAPALAAERDLHLAHAAPVVARQSRSAAAGRGGILRPLRGPLMRATGSGAVSRARAAPAPPSPVGTKPRTRPARPSTQTCERVRAHRPPGAPPSACVRPPGTNDACQPPVGPGRTGARPAMRRSRRRGCPVVPSVTVSADRLTGRTSGPQGPVEPRAAACRTSRTRTAPRRRVATGCWQPPTSRERVVERVAPEPEARVVRCASGPMLLHAEVLEAGVPAPAHEKPPAIGASSSAAVIVGPATGFAPRFGAVARMRAVALVDRLPVGRHGAFEDRR